MRAAGPAGVLRLKDVARIELGAQSYDAFNTLDGKPTIGTAVFLQSGANALDVAKSVKARMAELERDFPEGLDFIVPFDTTRFVESSIHEVTKTIPGGPRRWWSWWCSCSCRPRAPLSSR
ncbi:MAG: efflux RND transporter permease subunit [Burkholderiaceae bacterium]|nr:efflux RND transporter permease subunit [Burkholderiaceae bacterium]